MGLLSHTISVQSLQKSIPKILSLERKEGGREGDAWDRRVAWCSGPGEKERKRERGGERVFNPNNSQPQKTKLPLDSIKH